MDEKAFFEHSITHRIRRLVKPEFAPQPIRKLIVSTCSISTANYNSQSYAEFLPQNNTHMEYIIAKSIQNVIWRSKTPIKH